MRIDLWSLIKKIGSGLKKPEEDKKKKKMGPVFWLWFFTGVFLILCCSLDFLVLKKYSETILGMEWNWGWAAFWLQITYLLWSFRRVGPTETGVNLLFGKPIQKMNSGLTFVPYGIFELVTITKIVREKEYPDPEKLWRGDGPIPEGKIPPIRVIQGQQKKVGSKEEDPLDKRITTEVSAVVRYRITDFMTFIGTIGSLAELDRTIEDLLVADIRKELAIISPAQTLKTWGFIQKRLQDEVEKLVNSWGVEVQTVRLKEIDIGHRVNTALMDVVAATLNKKTTITNAGAEKEKRVLEGTGLAKARRILLEAEAFGYKKIANELNIKESELILFAETVKTLTENSQYTLLAGSPGVADLFATIGAIKNILPRIRKED